MGLGIDSKKTPNSSSKYLWGIKKMNKIQPKHREKIISSVEELSEELVRLVSEIVKIPSINPKIPYANANVEPDGETKVSEFLKPIMEDMGLEVDMFAEAEGRNNIVGVSKGTGGGKSLIFNGHIDVAPPGPLSDWTVAEPFSGKILDGKIYGRGAADMKSGNAAAIIALKSLLRAGYHPTGDVILQNVVGEEWMETEIGTNACLKRGYKADAAVVVESTSYPDKLAICPVQGNTLVMNVTVKGKAVHCLLRGDTVRPGGRGSKIGVSSIDKSMIIYKGLERLDQEWGVTKSHSFWKKPGWFFIYPTMITGSPGGPSLIPAESTLCYTVYTPPGEKPEQTKREIERVIELLAETDTWLKENPPKVEWVLNWPGFETPVTASICKAAHVAGEAVLDTPPQYAGFWMASDATFLSQAGIPTILLGPGAANTCHAANEYVVIDELIDAAKIYALLIAEWCGV